jgi:glycosyltransferase involved in cell wall biosynthesis
VFSTQLFQTGIPSDAQVVFVADLFADEYVGGAELTTQALIDSSPLKIHKLKSQHVTMELLRKGTDKFWIFGNFAGLNPQLIPAIVANLKYSILEYDYKFCRFRSPEKHQAETGSPCDCHEQINGKLISAFYYGATSLWWMSEKQKEKYIDLFPFLAEKDNFVLSSVFDPSTLGLILTLKQAAPPLEERKGWIVLGSQSWVKGFDAAKKWCEENNKQYEVVWNLPYKDLLAKLSVSEGFVYLPAGADTCPRMVIEAKLLGCKLQLNDHVQHKDEEWFATDDLDSISDYLHASREIFWNATKEIMAYKPKISGYTTTYNCERQFYPYLKTIESMLGFATEVCVVDGGSTDGTWEKLQEFAAREPRLKIKQVVRDWSHPRHGVFDGMQKAEARKMCTGEYCWQMDSDEVVHEEDYTKIQDLCRHIPAQVDVLSLPVIEYWGGPEKVRADITPWKWRLSRNKPNITHGIPVELRTQDKDGNLMALPGTDGCDMIDVETGERLPHVSFYTPEVDNVRKIALSGSEDALRSYENWFNAAVTTLPSVFHYSWYDLERKINLYKNYWQNHWNGLWGKDTSDTAENNMMFDVPWSQVTDQMIVEKASQMKEKLGGWIWHRKWDGEARTPHISCVRNEPKIMGAK